MDLFPQPMKALSVRAPWWASILYDGKTIENRPRRNRFRGPVLIHASAWFRPDDVLHDLWVVRRIIRGASLFPGTLDTMRALGGHIVGVVTITDCARESRSPWFFGPFGYVLADPRPLVTPVPCRGALGFFTPPPDVLAAVLPQIKDYPDGR